MKKLTSIIIGGIAGAVALIILHQSVKQPERDFPRVYMVGEEAIANLIFKTQGGARTIVLSK